MIATAIPVVGSLNSKAYPKAVLDTNQPCTQSGWFQLQKLFASDGTVADCFGSSVSLSGDTALIGARGCDNYKGSTYVFTHTGTTWTQQAKLTASDGAAGDCFGWSVSLSDDSALIGAYGYSGEKGAAYVFTRSGTSWTQQAKLLASDGDASDCFGVSVSLSGDTALIGSHGHDVGKGAAYVFIRTGTTWTQQAELQSSDGTAGDLFGYSVSLSGDTALIGAHQFSGTKGAVYVFTRTGSTWTQQAEIFNPGNENNYFGVAVSLSGNTALIGTNAYESSGSAYVFARSGTSWSQQAKLVASDGAPGDFFGFFVSLSDDIALIGAPSDFSHNGSAYVFTRSGTSWTQQAKLVASDGTADDFFGHRVSISGDTALIGAYQGDNYKGSAYVFMKDTVPPTVSITDPKGVFFNGNKIIPFKINLAIILKCNTIFIKANAVDSLSGIAKVDFYISTWKGAPVNVGTATTSPYQWLWNKGAVPGHHIFKVYAQAFDVAGNNAVSNKVLVIWI